jgi:hypothetical protein
MQRVVVVRPNQEPYIAEIENNFSEMQKIVNGGLNFLYLEHGFFIIHHSSINSNECIHNCEIHSPIIITKGLENIDQKGITGLSLLESKAVIESLSLLKESNLPLVNLPKIVEKNNYQVV